MNMSTAEATALLPQYGADHPLLSGVERALRSAAH